ADAPRVPPGEQRKLEAQRRQQLADQLKPHKKQREKLEKQLEALQAEQAELHARLQGNLSPAELADAGKRLKAVDDALAETEEAWLEVAALIEDLQNAAAV
ncbi:MAG: ABC transporter, partial [Burkholderiaceae bacterium]|nr:ABC transporter [Burkholderiaceae bacterium]